MLNPLTAKTLGELLRMTSAAIANSGIEIARNWATPSNRFSRRRRQPDGHGACCNSIARTSCGCQTHKLQYWMAI